MSWICADPQSFPMAESWLRAQVKVRTPWEKFTTMILMDGKEGEIGPFRAVALFCNYTGRNIDVHLASDGSKRWMTKTFLRSAFAYMFDQLKVERVTALVPAKNEAALAFDRHIGFIDEGRLRCAADDGSDLYVLGMLRAECRFLKDTNHGR